MTIYHAPHVHFPLKRSLALRWAVGLVILWSALSIGAWIAASTASTTAPITATTMAVLLWWGVCSALAMRFTWQLPGGVLHWDGVDWHFAPPTAPHNACAIRSRRVRVHIDGQSFVLICLTPDTGPTQWLWLERHMHPTYWLDMRRALYARPRSDPEPHNRPSL